MDRVTFAATSSLEGNTLTGIAHAFGQRTLVGKRYVEFARGAFDAALATSDVRAFLNHDTTLLLGRQSAGTLRLSAQDDGLHYSIDLPDTSYAADAKVLIDRGDLTEMSFGIVPGAVETYKAEDGTPVQLHTSVRDLFDISPVSLPAFGGTTIQKHSKEPVVPKTINDIMASMEAVMAEPEPDLEAYSALEADLERAQRTDAARERFAALKQPIVGFPAVVRPTPKGDAGLEFAFDQYLRTGQANHDISQLYAQTVGSTTGGGYTVPDGFLSRLVERRVNFGGLMNVAENLTTTDGRPLAWPSVVPAVYTEADIAAEGAATAAGADIVFGEVTLGAYRYVSAGTGNLALKVSVELLQDSMFDIGSYVARHLGERIARKQAYDLCNGSGSGAPQGIAYGTAGTIEADITGFGSLIDLVHALDPDYRPNARWIMNDATLAIIEKLLDGASGTSGRPLLTYGVGAEDSPSNGRLLGYPITIDQAMPTMNADDVIGIAFGDWKEAYIVRHVKDVQVLVNPYAATGYVTYEAWARMDGKVQNSYAYVTGEGV